MGIQSAVLVAERESDTVRGFLWPCFGPITPALKSAVITMVPLYNTIFVRCHTHMHHNFTTFIGASEVLPALRVCSGRRIGCSLVQAVFLAHRIDACPFAVECNSRTSVCLCETVVTGTTTTTSANLDDTTAAGTPIGVAASWRVGRSSIQVDFLRPEIRERHK